MQPDEALPRLRALGFSDDDAQALADHFLDAERRGKQGHGLARIEWLETQQFDPEAQPRRVVAEPEFERWESDGLGYLALHAIVRSQLASPPRRARLVVARCFPTGMLGNWVRRLADGGLVAVLTATSPPRLGHPEGGPKLAGTNPLAIGIPSSDGNALVADVSPAKATWGDVIAGRAQADDVVPFGGDQAHKAFALAVALQLLVDSFVCGHGALLLVARPEADPVPSLRARAGGIRLPGDR